MSGTPSATTSALAACALTALEHPRALSSSAVQVSTRVLRIAGGSVTEIRQALSALTSVAYGRPDLIDAEVADALSALLAGPPLPQEALAEAGVLLNCLLATPAAPRAIEALVGLLHDVTLPSATREVLLCSLAYAAFWAVRRLDLVALLTLAEQEHLAEHRDALLQTTVERVLFANLRGLTPELLERLGRLSAGRPSWRYCLAYVAGRSDLAPAMRRLVAEAVARQEAPRASVAARLGAGAPRVLMAQNIKDGQGDEIIRTVPLLESLLAVSPELRVVLITARPYLYAHPRIELVPIAERGRVRSALAGRFDAVVDFFEPDILQVNYDLDLERDVQAAIRRCTPWLLLTSAKGWGHFVYERLDLDGKPYAAALGLGRQRVANNYETTLRLLVELGLPVRSGEDPPLGVPVLAGLPCPDAEAAWAKLLAGNAERRPVALLWPFGGKPLKGYVERTYDDLADRLRALVADGLFVIVQPNGTPWGSPDHVRRVVDRLSPRVRGYVTVGPDPAAGLGSVSYPSPGPVTVPYASYVMHLVTYFVRSADLIVTVEGWMMHAAACLGKRYRVLMLPHSPPEWFPYARSIHQDVAPYPAERVQVPPAEMDGAPPLSEQPRKHALLAALRSLGWVGRDSLPFLGRVLRSEDAHVRLAAATALRELRGPTVDAELHALLDDPSASVRATAARALLERMGMDSASLPRGRHDLLLAHQCIGQATRDWIAAVRLGEPGRVAIRVALQDEDPVIRREAGEILGMLDRQDRLRGRFASGWALLGRSPLGRWVAGRRAAGG